MKSLTLTMMAAAMLVSFSARAGGTSFHSIIEESIEAKKDLSEKLRKNVEVSTYQESKDAKQKVTIHEEPITTEQIVSPSRAWNKRDEVDAQVVKIERRNMKRVAEEVKDAQE
jgi:hypothetical protein